MSIPTGKLCAFPVIAVAFIGAIVAACGGGGGGGGGGGNNEPPPPPPPPPPPALTDPIVYLASDDSATNIFELYLVDPATPGEAVKINAPLIAGGSVGPYSLSPDRTQVAYVAYQDSISEADLYLVELDNPGTATKLNDALPAGGVVYDFLFSPGGAQIAYAADQDVLNRAELYLVGLANPGASTKVNPDLGTEKDVGPGFSFSPDGTKILYPADQDTQDVFELYVVDVAAPGASTKVNPAFDAAIELGVGSEFSPDGNWIGYMSDQDTDGMRELFAVNVDDLGVSTKLNAPLVANGNVCSFEFSPDSASIAYCADQDVDETLELYLVELATPGVSARVNSDLVAGGQVQAGTFRFGPDSDYIVYRADQDVDGDNELYRVEAATPGTSQQINAPLVAAGDVSIFRINPDGSELIYVADQETEGLAELYHVEFGTAGAPVKLNPPRAGANVFLQEITEDGSQVLYTADQDTAGQNELFRIDIDTPEVATTINSSLPAAGDVGTFAIAPRKKTS